MKPKTGPDIDQILKEIREIPNPLTGETLEHEKRIESFKVESHQVWVRWSRDGLPLEIKRTLEGQIYQFCLKHFKSDAINIISSSSPIDEVPKKESAQLKVGHAQNAPKRSIPGVKNVILVASGKGGVGKSTFSVNLACALKHRGQKVGLVDADIYGPSLPMMLGKRFASPYATDDKKMLPINAYGLSFISFGLFIKESDPVIWRGPMLGGVLSQFFFDVSWGELDTIIVDLPPGTGDVQLSLAQTLNVTGLVAVTTPQQIASLDAGRAIAMAEKLEIPVLGLVENMNGFVCPDCQKIHHIFGEGAGKKLCEKTNTAYLGAIPLDKELRESADIGIPFMSKSANENSTTYKAYLSVAEKLEEGFLKRDPKKKSKGWVKSFFKDSPRP